MIESVFIVVECKWTAYMESKSHRWRWRWQSGFLAGWCPRRMAGSPTCGQRCSLTRWHSARVCTWGRQVQKSPPTETQPTGTMATLLGSGSTSLTQRACTTWKDRQKERNLYIPIHHLPFLPNPFISLYPPTPHSSILNPKLSNPLYLSDHPSFDPPFLPWYPMLFKMIKFQTHNKHTGRFIITIEAIGHQPSLDSRMNYLCV